MSDKNGVKRYLKVYLFVILGLTGFGFQIYSQQIADGTGVWETSANWSTVPDAGTLGGTISSNAVNVTGSITRNGALSVGNSLSVNGSLTVIGNVTGSNNVTVGGSFTINGNLSGGNTIVVNGTLTVNGSVSATGGSITVNNGGILYITSNLTSGISITVNAGGKIVVIENTTITGGNLSIIGDYVNLGNFSMTSVGATIQDSGNLLVGGNFTFGGGSIAMNSPISDNIYFINANPTITLPGYGPICTTSIPSCKYGAAADLLANDPTLATYVSSLMGCILTQPMASTTGCTGSSVSLNIITTGTGLTYHWQVSTNSGTSWSNISDGAMYSGSATSSLTILSPALSMSSYQYHCIVGGSSSATSTSSVLTVNTSPVITAQPSSSCSGYGNATSFSVTATGSGLSYQWQNSTDGVTFTNITNGGGYSNTTASTLNIAAWVASAITYYRCIVTSSGCSVISYNAVISNAVPPGPAGTITGTASVCQGASSVAYSVPLISGAPTYAWSYSGTGATITGNTQNITINFSSSATSGMLTVKGMSCTAGSSSPGFSIAVNASPSITATTPSAHCGTAAITLGATASSGTINWYAASSGGSSLGTGTSYTTPSISTTTPYYVDATASGCTSGSRSAIIATINSSPVVPTITGSTTVCAGATITLTPSIAGGSWISSNTAIATVTAAGVVAGVANGSSNITYTYTDGNGCSSTSAAYAVTVNALPATPMISASGATTFCFGGSVTLTSSTGTTYLWSTGATTASIAVTTSGAYTVMVTNAAGCQTLAAATANIIATPRPTSNITGPTFVCNGASASISVALTGTGPWNLTYYDGSSSTIITGITSSPYTFGATPVSAKTYTITALSDSKCTALADDMTGSVTLAVKSRPASAVAGAATICNGATANVSIALTGSSPWGLTYFNGTTSTSVSGITASPYVISVASAATYTVTALNDGGCVAQAADMTGSAAIIVNARPTGVITGTAGICSGNSTMLSIALTGNSPWNITYTDGVTPTTVTNVNTNPYTFSVSPVSTKTYTVTSLSDSKCTAVAADLAGSATITVNTPATASVLSGSATICNGSGTNLKVAITGGTSPFKVTLSDTTTTLGYISGGNILKSPVVTTTYSLTSVQDNNGCLSTGLSGSAVLTVITTPVQPSVITPGSVLACRSNTTVYSVTNDPVVATYNWSYSGTGAVLTPSGNSVSIAFGAAATSGTLTVTATNACGTSSSRTLAVTVNANVTPSVSIVVSPAGATCFGTNLTYTATPSNGGTPTYQWYLNSSAVGTNANTWSSNYILSSDAVKCVMTSSLCSVTGTNPATSNIITTTINKDVINLTSISATGLCAGSPITVNFTTPCSFVNSPVNVFIAQLSNASGSFTSPTTIGSITAYVAGTYSISATIPIATATGTGYLVRVVSSNASGSTGISGSSAAITIASSTGTPIAPTTFGSGVWNVFCYTGNAGYGVASGASSPASLNTYLGYYTETNLSFDTRTRWASGASPITTNTTSGSAYIGCSSMPASNIYLSLKRTNIPCGNYRIDIPYHDDAYELYIDGVQKATHNGCCDSHTGVWTGWIGPTNQIEIRLFQGSGGSGVQATFTSANLLSVSPNTTICNTASTTLVASGGGSSVTYNWLPASFLNTTTGASVVVSNPTVTTTYTVSATDIASGCATTANVTVNVNNAVVLALATYPVTTALCQGVTSTTITATGANSYTWSPATGLSATTGSSVVASPGSNVTYTVTGNNGCTTATKTISFTGQVPGDSLSFAPGAWYGLSYDTTLFSKYFGYYTENALSFNTTTKWNSTNGPATAANSTYTGCYMNGTYYSLKLKRTGVPCGYYSISIDNVDDNVWLYVNGVQMFTSGYSTVTQPGIWTGFVGPSTQLEFRLINYGGPGNLKVTFTPVSGIPNLSSPSIVCAGTPTTISTGIIAGDTYSWSSSVGETSWLSTTTGSSTIVTPPALTPNGNHYFIRTLTDGLTGCSVKDSVMVTVNPLANTSVLPADTTVYCNTATVKLTALGASTYTWSPATGLSATTGNTVNATPGVTTTYTVAGNNNCNTKNATANITVYALPAETIFPTGKWNIYGYNSTNWTNYSGFYTTTGSGTTGYDFDTRTQWGTAVGPSSATATGGTAYIGCTIGVDNFTTSFKRTGFTCGFYQIDMVFQDDAAELWIDGVRVWNNVNYTGTVQSNIWSCYLSNTSTVEFRQKEGGGGAGLAVQFTKKTPVFTSITVSPITGICASGSVNATLTAAATGVGNTYTWTPVAGLSATTGATTTALPAVTTKYYVRVSNCAGTVFGDTAITVTVLQPSIINTHPTPQAVCVGGNTSFTITASNTLNYQWEYSSNAGVSWSNVVDAGIYSGATLPTLTLTNVIFTYNSYKYRCRTTNWACSTVFSNDALLTVNQVPADPASITGTATVCQNATNVAYSITAVARATSYSWTLPVGATIVGGSGTNSILVNFGTASGNVAVVGVNSCGNSATPFTFPVTVNTSVPADPGLITGSASVCVNTTGVSYTVPVVTAATSYMWTVPSGATITSTAPYTNTISVNYGAGAVTGNITVVGVNPCGVSVNASTLAIIVNASKPGNPVSILGVNSICSGSSSNYSLGVITGATSYTWTLPSGSTITSGTNTNNVTVSFGATSGNIVAAGTNGCGSSTTPATLAVAVSTLLSTSPGTITGANSVCQSVSGITYSVGALSGATAYMWTVPDGASITTGSTTNSITTSYGAASSSGNVTVYGSNICGNGPASTHAVSVNSGIPNNPGSISGISTVCKSSTGKTYSISAVTGATSYTWTLPFGASITSGLGTNNITLSFNASATSGTLSVIGVNGCGSSSTPATFAISVIGVAPVQPLAFTVSSTSVCPGSSNITYTVPNDATALSYSWSYTGTGATFSSTTNSVSISFNNVATAGTLSVVANNDCGFSTSRSLAIAVNPLPGAAGTISGVSSVNGGTSGVAYTILAISNATSYLWSYDASGVTVSGTTASVNLDFATNAGSGNLTVTGKNTCGNGTVSANYPITVNIMPVTPTPITGTSSLCQGASGITYFVTDITNATGYAWTLPSGASITAGNNTNSITVSFSNTASSGNVSVHGTNIYGSGPESVVFPVIVKPLPVTGPLYHK